MTEWKSAAALETEAQFRQFLSYLFKQSGSLGVSDTGVVGGLGVVQTATASVSIVVGKGMALVQPSLTTGVSPLINNADKTVDILTGSPMGSVARWDLVIFNSDTSAIEVVVGAPNASPTDPPVTANHIKLARIRQIPTGQPNAGTIPAANIDDLRVYTTLNVPAAPSWVSTTPVYTNTLSESLSVGNGTIVGKYRVSASGSGQSCTFQGKFTRGSTSNVGTGGSWAITLPVTGVDFDAVGIGVQIIGGVEKQLLVKMVNSTTIVFTDLAGNRIGPSNPGGTAASQAGHVYQWSITYFLP